MSKMPSNDCPACHGFGSVRMTAHFHTEDREFEAPCWECFGTDVRLNFPHPRSKDNG
jgi:DnaJ-class molecular chaperone